MIQTVLREPGTGQSAPIWLNDKLQSPENSLATESVWIIVNSYSFLANTFGYSPSDPREHLTVAYSTDVTDPDANFRVLDSHISAWSQNLANLGTVARLVIPGLRELRPSEQDGLRQYRKRLFRKV
jgi:hypothetical protein